jgi:hypothetical protein
MTHAARDVRVASPAAANRLLAALDPSRARGAGGRGGAAAPPPDEAGIDPIEEGSNAWAFAPGRTRSGRAILVRNPHLAWDAGYYEAHLIVPGVLEFYGDFRIGGPFTVTDSIATWGGRRRTTPRTMTRSTRSMSIHCAPTTTCSTVPVSHSSVNS